MATTIPSNGFSEDYKTKPSVLKSIMTPRNHRRNPSAGLALSQPSTAKINPDNEGPFNSSPSDTPSHFSFGQPLGEVNQNRERARSSPRKPADSGRDVSQAHGKSMHKKTKSYVSLKSLVGGDKESKHVAQNVPVELKPKKSKSSTSLSTLLSRSKPLKGRNPDMPRLSKDKENQTPPSSAGSDPPPIWSQYASQPVQEISHITRVQLNDRRSVDEEMALYTPQEYSPSKQRNFHNYQQPTLAKRAEPKPRPKSAYLPSAPSMSSFAGTLSGRRKVSHERVVQQGPKRDLINPQRMSSEEKCYIPSAQDNLNRRPSIQNRKTSGESFREGLTMAKRGVRVMAAVAALNGKSKEQEKEVKVDVKQIDNAFEALLVSSEYPIESGERILRNVGQDSRNVPQNMRDRMRSLDTNIKADFIKQDKAESGSVSSTASSSTSAPWSAVSTTRPTQERSHTEGGPREWNENADANVAKKQRPRSRTFTLSKSSDSPTKKQKSDSSDTHRRKKSTDSTPSGPSKSLNSYGAAQAASFLAKGPKSAVPEDFISYLRITQKPENIEIGKLHKLRLLLRNETVAWVDSFITKGGMTEVVGLLHRIIKVEWRFVLLISGQQVHMLTFKL